MEMVPTPDTTAPSPDFSRDSESDEAFDEAKSIDTKPEPTGNTAPTEISKAVTVLIPSLKGKMSYVGGIVHCKGKWAMSDPGHDIEGQTSEFEFKLVKADENSGYFPINGLYQGWFALKLAPPAKGSTKIDDKEMAMRFTSLDEGSFAISGQGHNKFGKFALRGTLDAEGNVHIYREYLLCTPVAPPAITKKPESAKKADQKKVSIVESTTPRESTGRVRKQSAILKEYTEYTVQKTPSKPAEPASSSSAITPAAALARQNTLDRAHRLNPALKKCMDLLKELSKLQHAQWFLEPVDPIKYNIPDYPKIIKTPMDFATIRMNIENGNYDSVDGFAEHMRLVFRNAITYNTSRESLVNIAAREMSSKFEDKFRQLVMQLDPDSISIPEVKTPRGISSSSKKSKIPAFTKAAPGPRPGANYLPPAAVDGSTHQILEMQRMMQNMQEEIHKLRASVQEKEVISKIQETREAALNPLSFEEKKILVAQIHKLPGDKMDTVLEIIQEAVPGCGEEVEVPLDSLDTLTLRKLQKFVQEIMSDKKRSATALNTPKNGGNPKQPAAKKPRRGRISNAAKLANSEANGTYSMDFEDDGELLFEAESLAKDTSAISVDHDDIVVESFEQLQQRAITTASTDMHDWTNGTEYISQDTHLVTHEEDEDDNANMWSTAASEMPARTDHI